METATTVGVVAVLLAGAGVGLYVVLRRRGADGGEAWALDLGTTNSVLAAWDRETERPRVLTLPRARRRSPEAAEELCAAGVPSAVQVPDARQGWARACPPWLAFRWRRFGRLARIGQEALDLNAVQVRPNFVAGFKRALSLDPLLPVARAGGRSVSAREVAALFLRELLADAERLAGRRVRELVVTLPVDAYETYRAELQQAGRSLGLRKVRFLDEPVAAALGYGLGLARDRTVLVVDFGGGTLHVALVRLSARGTAEGRAEVLSKASRDLGGDLVDRWVLEELSAQLGWALDDSPSDEELLWQRLLLTEARRAKEAVYFQERVTVEAGLPETRARFEARVRGEARPVELTRARLAELLEERGLYRELAGCLDEVLGQVASGGPAVEDVLMVGGSTLLPGVFGVLEQRFGRDRVRAWQPFEAVALGAAVFAAGKAVPQDFIVHDYALLTRDPVTHAPRYEVVVPRRTRFPTPPALWQRSLVPTCGLGEPEHVFKLVVCEVGAGSGEGTFAWGADGRVRKVREGATREVVVKLNEANPAMGFLEPAHEPGDRTPRLDVGFGVNADRWLCATVRDLRTRKVLMREQPVVRLM